MVADWVRWHRAVGFEQLFLYYDDPTEMPEQTNGAVCFGCDQQWWQDRLVSSTIVKHATNKQAAGWRWLVHRLAGRFSGM